MTVSTPVRTCVVCGERRPREDLLRLALDPCGRVALDPRRRMAGRGAHVCPGCLGELRFTRRVQKAFRGRALSLGPGLAQGPAPGDRRDDHARGGRRSVARGRAAEATNRGGSCPA